MSIPVTSKVKSLSFNDILRKSNPNSNTNNKTTNKQVTIPSRNILDFDDDVEYLPKLTLPVLSDLDLPEEIVSRLFRHQKEGVSWLYSCYLNSSGALLADDMGLGKTFQTVTFLCGLMRMNKIRRALILCPVSVLTSWQREVNTHLIPFTQDCFVDVISADCPKKKRLKILYDTFSPVNNKSTRKQVIISSYQLVSNMVADFREAGIFDYVILDEGHIIKNASTVTSKSMHALRSHHRLLLTGMCYMYFYCYYYVHRNYFIYIYK